MLKLRDYQEEPAKKAIEFFWGGLEKDHPIIVQPTGSGKSVVIGHVANALETGTMVLQPSKELLEQNYKKFKEYGGEASIFSASMGLKEIGHTTFATIGSVKKVPHLFEHVRNILIDECHLLPPRKTKKHKDGSVTPGSMFMDFIENLPGVRVLGLTATPFRLKRYMDPFTDESYAKINMLPNERPRFFNSFLHVTQIGELYKGGYLAPIKNVELEWKGSNLRSNTTGAEYSDWSMAVAIKENKIIERLPGIVRQSVEKGRKHRLVFVDTVANAQRLASAVPSSACIHAETKPKERQEIIDGFKSGKILTVFNVNVLTTGFDFPALDTIILARPTMSLALFMQMVGRGIRPSPEKKDCVLVDMCGNIQQFSPLEEIVYDRDSMSKWQVRDSQKVLSGVKMGGEKVIHI